MVMRQELITQAAVPRPRGWEQGIGGCVHMQKDTIMPNDDEIDQRIRERAYLIWLDEGRPEGRDKQHWEIAREAIERENRPADAAERSQNQSSTKPF
jgi:hypothetical protein